jgi:bifunctional non-homologous end joining protein LigD
MNVIEFHTWNAVVTNINKPDRMTFDLDPGDGVTWPVIQEWSARARLGLGVSVPVAWAELDTLSGSSHWIIANIKPRLNIGNDPRKAYSSSAQKLGDDMKILDYQPARISSIK